MAKPRNSMEVMARAAAARLDEARQVGVQLSMLPDEPGPSALDVADPSKGGRPKGATNKGSSQMREYLAARGYRLPEQVLAEMAGLASSDDALTTAMVQAERVLAWAFDGAAGGKVPEPEQRLAMFAQLYATQLRAADALMPYGAAKASPDVAVQQTVQMIVQGGASRPDPPEQARNVTRSEGRMTSGLMPADVRWQIEQNQTLTDSEPQNSDGATRTKRATD